MKREPQGGAAAWCVGAVVVMLAFLVACAMLSTGCTTANLKKVYDAAGGLIKDGVPKEEQVDYADPAIPDHGQAFTVNSPDGGDSWTQYSDGYFETGFVRALDEYSLPGWGALLRDNGGRDCGAATILGVICKANSFTDWPTDPAGNRCPNDVEWRIIVQGGFEIQFSYRHTSDTITGGTANAIDVVRKVKVGHRANGFNGGGVRHPDVYKAKDGKDYFMSIRFPFWRHGFSPVRAATVSGGVPQ